VRGWLFAFACVAACSSGGNKVMNDLSAASPDMQAAPPLTLTVAGNTRPMSAWYSFYVRPLADDPAEIGVYLVVTAIDPAFACSGPAPDVDALSFLFGSRLPGTSTSMLLARHGPDLATTSSGSGYMQLDSDDDKLGGYDLDGGVVFAGSGGSVGGRVHFTIGSIVLDGKFTATRCAALDFIVAG
jgi:hypothetical protein